LPEKEIVYVYSPNFSGMGNEYSIDK
jgi:hypothetical protein